MSKKYLNGWQAPKFEINGPGVSQTIELNLRYQAFNESVEETYIEHELLDGSLIEKFLYAHYYWDLNYSALAEASELLKIKSILNYLQLGYDVRLYPHKEIQRYFHVTTVKGRRVLGRHYGGDSAPGEKDFSITFRTRLPVYSPGHAINWAEITDAGIPAGNIDNQYSYISTEEEDYLLDEAGYPMIVSE